VSQISVNYRASPLSEGRAGKVCGGDRLPWVSSGAGDNFAPLSSLAWQVHIYGEASASLKGVCAERGLSLQVFPWRVAIEEAGLKRDALYLVRPDGYIALALPDADPKALLAYLDARNIAGG
jgi:hypothetical protein